MTLVPKRASAALPKRALACLCTEVPREQDARSLLDLLGAKRLLRLKYSWRYPRRAIRDIYLECWAARSATRILSGFHLENAKSAFILAALIVADLRVYMAR